MAKRPLEVPAEDDTPKSFESILDMPISELTRPKPLPQGTYKTTVRGLPKIDKSTKKGTEFSEYTLQILEAYDDVDQEALAEVLTKGNGEVQRLQDRSLRLTFYHTQASGFRLADFLVKDLGIDKFDEDGNERSPRELMQEAPGRQVAVHVKHDPSPDGETMYANIDKTFPVTD
jgi:hypothetical protein